ncbi:ABC transporter permease [Xylanimonas ulmi]|uniref:ABC transporter permease n=1 Tax=Xylanimonas ulmi TaxID=228973 RepID=UPI001F5F9700|nr:ABC transporter permease [Xylanibacterium ulmi]
MVLLALCAAAALTSLLWLPFALDDTTGGRLEPPNPGHLLGTDRFGRDLLSQVLVGVRIAFMVGIGSALIATVIGVLLGLTVAWAPSWVDDTAATLLDILLAFPTLLLAMIVGATQGRSTATVVVSIGLAQSAYVARLSRILARRLRAQRFVTAAATSGSGRLAITIRHLLPNMLPTLAVVVAVSFGIAVLAEAGLSYLGLGVPPPSASLGRLMQEAQSTVLTAPMGAIAPGVVVVLLVVGANFLADGLRDDADPASGGLR